MPHSIRVPQRATAILLTLMGLSPLATLSNSVSAELRGTSLDSSGVHSDSTKSQGQPVEDFSSSSMSVEREKVRRTPPKKVSGPWPPDPSDLSQRAVFEIHVDMEGDVSSVEVVQGGNPEFNAAAIEAISQWKYEPATRDGEPVDAVVRTSLTPPSVGENTGSPIESGTERVKTGANTGNAGSAVGEWLSEDSSAGGFRSSLTFSPDGRVRLAMGVTIGLRWSLQEQQDDRYIVRLAEPAKPEEPYAIELHILRGKKTKLVQRSLEGGEAIKMTFVARGHQPEKPDFLGRWTYTLEGAPVLQDYNEDGWAWTRIVFRTAIGSYSIEGDRVVFDWKDLEIPLQEARLEDQELIVESEEGQDSRFLRPKVAVVQTEQPEASESTAERLIPTIVTGEGLLDKRIFQKFELVGEVSDIRFADLHPTPGEELGIAGSHGAVLFDGDGKVVHEVRFTDPGGTVEMVDVQGDGSTEFMNRGGGWQPVSLLDHDGRTLWSYDPEFGANDMAAGDLDADGRLEFVVGCNGTGGVHVLESGGKRRWAMADANVWHIAILDADGDRQSEIVHTNVEGKIIWRNAKGAIREAFDIDAELTDFTLLQPVTADRATPRLVFHSPSEQEVKLISLKGDVEASFETRIPDAYAVYGAWAHTVALEPNKPPLTSVTLWLRLPYESNAGALLLYDESGALLYHEITDQKLSAMATIPGTRGTGTRLLVGGNGLVWEYQWAG